MSNIKKGPWSKEDNPKRSNRLRISSELSDKLKHFEVFKNWQRFYAAVALQFVPLNSPDCEPESLPHYNTQNWAYLNPEEHFRRWPWWKTQNDALRKIVFGNILPIPLVSAIHKISDNAFKSFLTKRWIVDHNASSAAAPSNVIDRHGAVLVNAPESRLTELISPFLSFSWILSILLHLSFRSPPC